MSGTTIGALQRVGTRRLRDAGIDGAARDAAYLLAHVLDMPRDRLLLCDADPATNTVAEAYSEVLARREARQPVAQIIGRRKFWDRAFRVSGDVLDPRPESEALITAALAGPPARRILDLGTGSGVLVITLLAVWEEAEGLAVDLSRPALDVAAANAHEHAVVGRLRLVQGDWGSALAGGFDLIVCSPPYIAEAEIARLASEVTCWEPRLALSPGVSGLESYAAIAPSLPSLMQPGTRALFEIGVDQAEAVTALLVRAGMNVAQVHRDMGGCSRVVEVVLAGSGGRRD